MRELASHLLDLHCDISKIQNEIQDIVEARLTWCLCVCVYDHCVCAYIIIVYVRI